MDAEEFLNLFLDKLSNLLEKYSLSESKVKKLIKFFFVGAFSHEIKCKECNFISSSEEMFISVNL